MRAVAATTVLCLAASIVPSCTAATIHSERAGAAPPASLGKTAASSIISTAVSILAGTGLTTLFSHIGQKKQGSRREVLEYIEARLNQELAARAYKRELLSSILDMRALNELD
ncbi:hypothetical protein B0F90DRAFT_1668006 [Multifurca ochricompacta]|uniref:Uncharacterized protein n=1 Tax=Multifurca ochricompacta TaxID=376703 RepID=A0AAD4QNL2_9AGAM|nr:hypothetical protein B0F90DRAFT_1668006 [Multifurca ochricompacta]